MVGRFDVDGGAEARLVNKDVNIKEGEMVQVNWTGQRLLRRSRKRRRKS